MSCTISTGSEPLVSILIPCYNAERWIAQAITSALNQTYPVKEVCIVDDGSTDGSLQVIKQFAGKVRWESGPNRGGNAARSRLLELSVGEWLQYLDADDYLLPEKVAGQVECSRQNRSADVIYSPAIIEHQENNHAHREVLPTPEPRDPWILLARWFLPQTGSPLWLRQAVIDVGGWKVDQPCCQEHELYNRLLKAGKRFVYHPHAQAVYRQWSAETLCKKDQPQVFRQRLSILADAEQYLRDSDQLTFPRRQAINTARLECARLIWLTHPGWAQAVVRTIHTSDPHFVPAGRAAPFLYRCCYRWFGFQCAETVAAVKRRLMSQGS